MEAVTASLVGGALSGAISGAGAWLSGDSSARAAKRMYKHRYQWQMQDMRKAGLNPMLSVSQGAPNVPQPDFPNVGEAAVEGFAKGQSARLMASQVEAAKAATETTRAQGSKAVQEGRAQEMQNLILEASPLYQSAKSTLGERGEVRGPSALASERWTQELRQVANSADKAAADADVSRLNADLAKGELSLQAVRLKYADQLAAIEAAYRRAMATAAQAGVPQAQADAEFWENSGAWGKAAMFLKQIIGGGIAPVILK